MPAETLRGCGPAISILLPTVKAWPAAELALRTARAQECAEEHEVLLLDGHGGALPGDPGPPVRWIRVAGADVFKLRAKGIVEARGEVVVITEDHCVMPSDWCSRILAAHRRNPASALIGPISNHPDSAGRAVDRANFLLTMGPYSPPIEEPLADRLPVPTNLSFKRRALPRESPEPGWIEYELIAQLQRRREVGLMADAVLEHRQRWSCLLAPWIHFCSGRSYGAATRSWPPGQRRLWIRGLAHLPGRILRMTKPSLERGAGGAPPSLSDRLWLIGLTIANVLGQLLGALAGPGSSRRRI